MIVSLYDPLSTLPKLTWLFQVVPLTKAIHVTKQSMHFLAGKKNGTFRVPCREIRRLNRKKKKFVIFSRIRDHTCSNSRSIAVAPDFNYRFHYRTTCIKSVEFFAATVIASLALSSLLSSCQIHLPMRDTLSIEGLQMTNRVRQIPSVGLGCDRVV